MSKIFVSYSSKNRVFAEQLVVSLQLAGFDPWVDKSSIPAGKKWSKAVQLGLDECPRMVLIVSPASVESRHVEDEWQYFLDNDKTIIPVLLEQPKQYPFQLSRLQYIDFSKEERYTEAFQTLINALKLPATGFIAHQQTAEVQCIPSFEGTLQAGTVLHRRYRIQNLIGTGKSGAVYQARDLDFSHANRIVAIKEILMNYRNPMVKQKQEKIYQREVNILATLNHRAIPAFFDIFKHENRHYIVMQHIDGSNLEAILNKPEAATIPLSTILEWAIELCDVLAYLHEYQPDPVLFRDMKPSNVMIDTQGHVRLVDFGLAKMLQSSKGGTMIGTEGYAAPEQYRGQSMPASDIYRLGTTLHHLLTGCDPRQEMPFSFSERPISKFRPNAPEALSTIIEHSLAYSPSDRYTSARAMGNAFKLLCSTEVATDISAVISTNEPSSPIVSTQKQPCWKFGTEDEIQSSPIVVNEHVYFGTSDHNMYCVGIDGTFKWMFPTSGEIVTRPVYDMNNRQIIFGSKDHKLYAIDAQESEMKWVYQTGGEICSSATIAHEHVFWGG